jgi:erythromycin esterase-like protein
VQVSVYGLDLYGLHFATHEINQYLKQVDPKAAKKIRERYHATFEGSITKGFAF